MEGSVPVRSQPIDTYASALDMIAKRIRKIDESLRSRLFPPGYRINIVDGDLVITRKSDGATSTMEFT